MQPCEQKDTITEIRSELSMTRSENQQILRNQEILVEELKKSFARLEQILLTDVEHKKDIEQLKKDVDSLGGSLRAVKADITSCKQYRDKLDGMGLMERFPSLWDFMQNEKGWRRFIPATLTALACLAAVMTWITSLH